VWEACFETAGDDIGESVTQELLGDYIVAVKLAKHWQYFLAGVVRKQIADAFRKALLPESGLWELSRLTR
jgi:hypothetical protein